MNQFCLNAHPGSPKICHGTFQAQFLFWIHLLKKKDDVFTWVFSHDGRSLAVEVPSWNISSYSFFSEMIIFLPNQKIFETWAKLSWSFDHFFGDIVEFLDGNVLRWKMLEMQMPWPDIDVCVIFKKRRCSGWKRGETHWILNIPKAYNSLPLQKWRLCRVLSFWEG